MQKEALEELIIKLEVVQINLMRQRRDHNGNILERDDIDAIQTAIDILLALSIEPTNIWKKIK